MGNTRTENSLMISRDNLGDIDKVNDETLFVIYKLSQPIAQGDIRYDDVTIKRPKLKHQKLLAQFKDAEQASKLIQYTCEIATHLIDELDLADVMVINKIIMKMLGKSQEI